MFGKFILFRSLRRLHRLMEQDPIEDSLRGWSWDKPPIRPRAYLNLGVSQVAYKYCPTRRDIYLRWNNVKGCRNIFLRNGSLVHEVFHLANQDVRRELIQGFSPWMAYENISRRAVLRLKKIGVNVEKDGWLLDLYKSLTLSWCADKWIGFISEYRVDGSPLGLSKNLHVDGLAEGSVVIEIKYGRPYDFHKLGLAGYALALECFLEAPFDYGILIYVSNNSSQINVSWEPVYISPYLRKEFLEARDEVIDLILSEREPPIADFCPESCPYRGVCR